jgi:ATP-dependent helicase/nuclease subunit A
MTSEAERDWREVIDGSLAAQKDAITSTAALTVVSAGAGTGKTETLAKRVAWLLAGDPECSVEQILVLTFTEKAALEMRERIEKMLRTWLAAYPKELAHLKKCVDRIEDAQISTIHSFAMKIIRESGLALDLDPDAAIIPTPNETIWWETFANALDSFDISQLLPLLKKDSWDERAKELFADDGLRSLVTDKGFSGPQVLAQAAQAAAAKLGSCGQTPLQLWEHDDTNLLKDIENHSAMFREIWDLWLKDIFPNLSSEFKDKTINSLLPLRDVLFNFSQSEDNEENEKEFAKQLINEGLKKLPSNAKQKTEVEKLLGGKMVDWRKEMEPKLLCAAMPDKREVRYAELLNKVCALGWQCWDELRRQSGLMSQDDLVRFAVDVLKNKEDYGSQFKHILIDEFQDTDDMQDKMLGFLWKPGENTLFIVGDLKQSIYRFRHAKPENFQRYITDAQSCTDGSRCYVSLDRSFRTRSQLLERFNTLFEDIWTGGYIEKDKDMKYEEIYGPDDADAAWWKTRCGEGSNPVIETMVAVAGSGLSSDDAGATSQGRENANFVRYRLFTGLAERIAALRAGGMKVWNKKALGEVLSERAEAAKKGEKLCGWDELSERIFTPAAWKDFSILVPSRKAYQPIETAFSEAGVPYVLCTSKDYYSRNEVTDVINLLTLLAEPDSALALAGWLSSPFSGVQPQEAESCMNEAYSQRSGRDPMPLESIVAEKRPDVAAELETLRKAARLRGVAAVIAEISKSQDYLLCFEPEKRARVTANLAYLAQLAEEYEASQGRSLIGCADYMSSAVSLAEQQEEPDVTDEDEDAVNVLTIHASKGLEYPVVAVVGAESGTAAPKGICVSERYGMVDRDLPDFMLDGRRERS